eukprot:525188-Amphidinium_carterae.1
MHGIKLSSCEECMRSKFVLRLGNIGPESSKVLSIHAPILGLNPRMVTRASKTEHISSHGCHSSTSRIS